MRKTLMALLITTVVASTGGVNGITKADTTKEGTKLSFNSNVANPAKAFKAESPVSEKSTYKIALDTKSAIAPVKIVRIAKAAVKPGESNYDRKIRLAKEKAAAQRHSTSGRVSIPSGVIPSDAQYRDWILAAAQKYGVANQAYALWIVMKGESGGNPYAHNSSGASGLFQFMPSTWRGTPYGTCSIWDAKSQVYAAAWMFSCGRQREWVVYNMHF